MEESVSSDEEFETRLEYVRKKAPSGRGGMNTIFTLARLLHQAVLDGNEARVVSLLQEGVDADSLIDTTTRRSCLFAAAAYGHTGVVTALCTAGADVNRKDSIGWSPAMLAFFYGRNDTLERLKELGADTQFLPYPVPSDSDSPSSDLANQLRTAALTGDEILVERVLQSLGDLAGRVARHVLSGCDFHGRSPLTYAALFGHLTVVERLLGLVSEYGLDVDNVDLDSLTPLALAVRRGHWNIARCLLTAGAQVTRLNGGGHSLLQTAVCRGDIEGIRLLLEHAPSPDYASISGKTPLIEAANVGHLEATSLLLQLGASVDLHPATGYTALLMGTFRGHAGIVRMLLEAGANVNHIATDGRRSVLHCAAMRGKSSLLRLLLNFKPCVLDHRDIHGRTALHYCASLNDIRLARLLLLAGANKWIKDVGVGCTAVELAKKAGHNEWAAYVHEFCFSLQDWCKFCIRRALSSPITQDTINSLHLPKMAKNLLLLI